MTKVVCVIPAASAATRNKDYFEIYKTVLHQYTISRIIVLFPQTHPGIFVSAASSYANTRVIVTPMGVENPYAGFSGFKQVIEQGINYVIKDVPDKIIIITSGGTTKMGHLVTLLGNVCETFSWEVSYLWLAKSPSSPKYKVTVLPKIVSKFSDRFEVNIKNEKSQKPIIEVVGPKRKIT